MFLFPFAIVTQGSLIYQFNYNGFNLLGKTIAPAYPLCGLIIACLLIAFISIFFYKKRSLQIKLNVLNIILFVLIYVVETVYLFISKDKLPFTDYSIQISSALPILNIILTYLAIRSIRADQNLVESLNRLR
jgi:membrane-associated HD superfamily phosphohydrolase